MIGGLAGFVALAFGATRKSNTCPDIFLYAVS